MWQTLQAKSLFLSFLIHPVSSSSLRVHFSNCCHLWQHDICLFFFFFFKFYLFILFMAVLGLRFCARALSSCGKRGPLFMAVRGPLTVAASLVAEHRLQTRRLSSCGSRAQLLRGMWDLPRPGLERVSPALAGRLSTTAPPGKPDICLFYLRFRIAKLTPQRLFISTQGCAWKFKYCQRRVVVPGTRIHVSMD